MRWSMFRIRSHWQTIALLAACFGGGCEDLDISGFDGTVAVSLDDGRVPWMSCCWGEEDGRKMEYYYFGVQYGVEDPPNWDFHPVVKEARDMLAEALDGEPDCAGKLDGEMEGWNVIVRYKMRQMRPKTGTVEDCKLSTAKRYEDSGRNFACVEERYDSGAMSLRCRFL